PEIAHDVLLGVAPFLMSDNHAPPCAEHGNTAWHGAIVGEAAVAVQFDPVGETALYVIESERPVIVPRELHPLPSGQITINLAACSSKFASKFPTGGPNLHIVLCGMSF